MSIESGSDHRSLDLRGLLLRGSAWAAGGRLATGIVVLGVHALVAHLLPPADVGRFFLMYSVVLVASTVGRLGIGRTVVRQLGQVNARDCPGRARPVLARAFLLVGVGGIVVASVLGSAPGDWILGSLGASDVAQLRLLIAFWILALVLEGTVAEAFRGLHMIARAATFNGLLSSSLLIVGLLARGSGTGGRWAPELSNIAPSVVQPV